MYYILSLVHIYHSIFFFNDTATTEIYTLSLHDALPISAGCAISTQQEVQMGTEYAQQINAQLPIVKDPEVVRYINVLGDSIAKLDRKSTRLNSSHSSISYAVFCLKKKKKHITHQIYVLYSLSSSYISFYFFF